MKPLSLLIASCLLFQCAPLFAQNTSTWFPPGAKWAFTYQSINGGGEEYLDLVGQEMVGGELCAKLHYHGYENVMWSAPFDLGFRYFFARNDSVFLWNGSNAFDLLYDFNRVAGDSFQLPVSSIYDRGLVVKTGDTTWNGIPVRFQDLKLSAFSFFPDGDTLYLNTRVYERLGGTHLIYWDIESPLTEIQYYLGCYRDDEYPQTDCPLGYDPTYTGFPQFGISTWSETDGSWCSFRGYQYKVEGDTAIFGIGQGKKVYFRNTYTGMTPCPDGHVEIIHEPFRLIGLLDQSVQYKKVYFTRLTNDPVPFPICVEGDSLPVNAYTLLYDFDLEVGDTVQWKPQPNVVQAIDSIQLDNGAWRRTFVFDTNNPHFWIEGIGSNFGLLGSFANSQITDISCQLQCFRYNSQVMYSTVDAVFCDSIAVATNEPNSLAYALKIFPNPAANEVTIALPATELPASVRLTDVLGRVLGQVELREESNRVDISRMPAHSMVFARVQGKSGQSAGSVLKIE